MVLVTANVICCIVLVFSLMLLSIIKKQKRQVSKGTELALFVIHIIVALVV